MQYPTELKLLFDFKENSVSFKIPTLTLSQLISIELQ